MCFILTTTDREVDTKLEIETHKTRNTCTGVVLKRGRGRLKQDFDKDF